MTARLPRLRRRRRRINFADIAAKFHDGIREVDSTIEPFAQLWDEWNHEALHEDGPLWVALGDSVTQGIGTSNPTEAFPITVRDHLRAETGQPWRLINLSMSGARFRDVIEHQLPVLHGFDLRPTVVSAVIGSNDYVWRRNTRAIRTDAEALVHALPADTILSRVSDARPDQRRLAINQVFDAAGSAGRVRLYRAWDWPTGRGMWAADNFHPNDLAHTHLADNLIAAFADYGVTDGS